MHRILIIFRRYPNFVSLFCTNPPRFACLRNHWIVISTDSLTYIKELSAFSKWHGIVWLHILYYMVMWKCIILYFLPYGICSQDMQNQLGRRQNFSKHINNPFRLKISGAVHAKQIPGNFKWKRFNIAT